MMYKWAMQELFCRRYFYRINLTTIHQKDDCRLGCDQHTDMHVNDHIVIISRRTPLTHKTRHTMPIALRACRYTPGKDLPRHFGYRAEVIKLGFSILLFMDRPRHIRTFPVTLEPLD